MLILTVKQPAVEGGSPLERGYFRPGLLTVCAVSVLQILFDCLFMFGDIATARLLPALSTFWVIGGVDALAPLAAIVFSDFFEPLSMPDRLDSFKIRPKFYSMRHCRLKLVQFVTRVLFTFATEVDASFSGAS